MKKSKTASKKSSTAQKASVAKKAATAKKSRLGRGLDGLISGGVQTQKERTPVQTAPTQEASSAAVTGLQGYEEIEVRKIEPNPHQPRREFDEVALNELVESIRSEGLLQPVVVRRHEKGYLLIAGERRWRACQALKLKRIPARIIEASETSAAVMALIENLQRESLNPIEEALGFASLMRDFDLTQEAVAERVGKPRATVANALRLLQLSREIQGYITRGHLSVGHAKVLLGLEEGEKRQLLARRVMEKGLSVRETENLARILKKPKAQAEGRSSNAAEDAAIQAVEKQIALRYNTGVQLKHTPRKGRIVIDYYGNDDLQRILDLMGLSGS